MWKPYLCWLCRSLPDVVFLVFEKGGSMLWPHLSSQTHWWCRLVFLHLVSWQWSHCAAGGLLHCRSIKNQHGSSPLGSELCCHAVVDAEAADREGGCLVMHQCLAFQVFSVVCGTASNSPSFLHGVDGPILVHSGKPFLPVEATDFLVASCADRGVVDAWMPQSFLVPRLSLVVDAAIKGFVSLSLEGFVSLSRC